MPHDAPEIKVNGTRGYGAEVVFYNRYTESREGTGEQISQQRGLVLVPPFDDDFIMAGQGTAAVELFEDVPELDFLLSPCSGCGLLAGLAVATKHLSPSTRIFGVEPEAGNDTWQSMQRGERVQIEVPKTIADGLQTTAPGKLTFPIVKEMVEDILLVSDDELISTIRFILERMKVLGRTFGRSRSRSSLSPQVRFFRQARRRDFVRRKCRFVEAGWLSESNQSGKLTQPDGAV